MATENRLGRNASCPCGSGKKFKQCCLGKTQGPQGPGPWGWSAIILLLGFVGAGVLWNAKGAGSGLAGVAGTVIIATAVYIFRDPAPPRGGSSDASAINFGK